MITTRLQDLSIFLESFSRRSPFLKGSLEKDVEILTEDFYQSNLLANAWTTSLLGYKGSPIEFTTSTLKPSSLSCTIDPFVKTSKQQFDLKNFQAYYERVASPTDSNLFNKVTISQQKQALRFGSWLGLKYSPKGRQVKVYSEVVDQEAAYQPFFDKSEYSFPGLKEQGLKLLMVGYYPAIENKGVEHYYQWNSALITPKDIFKVMSFFGCSSLYPPLTHLLKNVLLLTPKRGGFPETTYGFSLSYDESGKLEVFTLFTMANTFFGENWKANLAIKRLMEHYNWKMPFLSDLIDQKVPIQHNVLGLSVSADGQYGINSTFSPENISFEEQRIVKRCSPTEHVEKEEGITALLKKYQLENGAFPSSVLLPGGKRLPDANAFVTAHVLRLLPYNPDTSLFIEKAISFLKSCAVGPYRYSFWPSDAHPSWMKEQQLAPDIDDTSIVMEVLYKFGHASKDDLYQCFIEMNKYCLVEKRPHHAKWLQRGVYLTWMNNMMKPNLVDCCANTNALILLHLAEQQTSVRYHAISKMLKEAIAMSNNEYNKIRNLIPYYAHPAEWLYTLQYARQIGVPSLDPIIEILASKWSIEADGEESPLYCRHDGRFIWVAPVLSELRSCLDIPSTKKSIYCE